MKHTRTDLIPVQGSEVMRRCNIDLQTWRSATDVEREAWRKQAREQIAAEIAKQPKPGQEGIQVLLDKIAHMESTNAALTARIVHLESANDTRIAEISNLGNRLNHIEKDLPPKGKHQ